MAVISLPLMFRVSAAGDAEVLGHHRRLLPAVCGVGQKSCECLLFSLLFKSQTGLHTERGRALQSTVHSVCVDDKKMTNSHNSFNNYEAFSQLKQNLGVSRRSQCSPGPASDETTLVQQFEIFSNCSLARFIKIKIYI